MTDAEIKKALAHIIRCNNKQVETCDGCLIINAYPLCEEEIIEQAFDLINRLQASKEHYQKMCARNLDNVLYLSKQCDELQEENERLLKECGNQSTLWRKHFESIYETAKETIKAEACKECIEAVKDIICANTYPDFDKNGKAVNIWSAYAYRDLDNLLKEMESGKV